MLSFLVLSQHASATNWKLDQVIYPDTDSGGIFGRSIAISSKISNRIAVGASWENVNGAVEAGAIYIYDYNSNTGNYSEKYKKIYATDVLNSVIFNNTGSTLAISSDGTRIVTGSPYSNVYGKDSYRGDITSSWLQQVGAVAVFDLVNGTWSQTATIVPSYLWEYQGFGRGLTISSDGKRIAGSYYNKIKMTQYLSYQGMVFVTYEKSDGTWAETAEIKPPTGWNGQYLKFGSSIEFADDSTLIVAVQLFNQSNMNRGTMVYKRSGDNNWTLSQEISPAAVTGGMTHVSSYGQYVSMPSDTSTILGVNADFKNDPSGNPGAFYLLKEDGSNWSTTPTQVIYYPKNTTMTGIWFCNSSMFASFIDDGTANPNKSRLCIFTRQSNGSFVETDQIAATSGASANLSFGSSFQWRSDCQVMVVGAMNMYPFTDNGTNYVYNNSHAYVFKYNAPMSTTTSSNTGLIVGLSVGGAVILTGAVVGVVFALRHVRAAALVETPQV